MSYLNLARRYRPQKFTQMVGQSHVLKALINAISSDRVHHAYLFTGTRGVGKTTVARIFAKCLNCHSAITSDPCESCASCTEINNGRSIDLIEIDAASRTKVEDTRELLANIQYAAAHSRFKIYLIDEVHMLSLQSFNALLKTLEEPPEHVKFLLATTDPQKIPITILSRCLQFNLKQMSSPSISGYLEYVLKQENIKYDLSSLDYIAQSANGSMRDALSITDQAIAYTNGILNYSEVANMLGSVDQNKLIDILQAVAKKQAAMAITIIRDIADQSPDFDLVLDDLLKLMHDLSIIQLDLQLKNSTHADLTNLASLFMAEELQLFYQIIITAKKDLSVVADAKSIFEMAILRMIAFSPESAVIENNLEQPQYKSEKLATNPSEITDRSEQNINEIADTANVNDGYNIKEPQKCYHKDTSEVTKEAIFNITSSDWIAMYYDLDLKGITKNIGENSSFVDYSSNNLQLCLSGEYNDILNESHLEQISKAVTDFTRKTIDVVIIIDEHKNITPYQWQQNSRKNLLNNAHKLLANDKKINAFMNSFDAYLSLASIQVEDDSLGFRAK